MTGLPLLHWLYVNVWGNLVASGIVAVAAWFWKIRPHVHAQRAHRVAETQHRANLAAWIEGLHERLDLAGVPDTGDVPQSGAHGATEHIPVVPDGR